MEYTVWKKILYENDGKRRINVNMLLVAANVIIWCILEIFGDTLNGNYIITYGGLYPPLLLYHGEWYRIITSIFLHFGAQHLANNMILLVAVGGKLEEAVGSLKYLMLYLGAGVTGNLLSMYAMLRTGEYAVCAGASGAIFGTIAALAWIAVRNKGKFAELTTKGLLFVIVLCLYNGITSEGVDNWAHIGGAIGGFFLCVLLYRKPQDA